MARRRTHEAAEATQTTLYHVEHWLAWVAAGAAIVLAAIGILWGFGYIEETAATFPGVEEGDVTAGEGAIQQFWEGMLWLLPAVTLAFLSVALHRTEHHRVHQVETVDRPNMALMGFEHILAWLAAGSAIALAVVGLLVGFDVADRGNVVTDGILWHVAGLGAGVLAIGLHGVRHHQMVAEEDMIIRIVEERVGMAPGTRTTSPPERGVPEFRSR